MQSCTQYELLAQQQILKQGKIISRYKYLMPLVGDKYLLDGDTLTVADLDTIIKSKLLIDLTPEAWAKAKKSRQTIYHMMSDNKKIVYGINTGFGNFADKIITFQEREKLQNNLIRSHSVCVGEPLPLETVKRMMILRINTLCKGRSGIQPENLLRYIEACNSNFLPMIPEKGTVGASGDLAPLSHLALGMMGQGLAWCEKKLKFIDAHEVMANKKLKPISLKQKEGLALINGTQFMSSIISDVNSLSRSVLQSAIIVYAFAIQIFGVEPDLLSKQAVQYYTETQRSLGQILKKTKSYLNENTSELHKCRLQNNTKNNRASSIVNAFQNLSAVFEALNFCQKLVNQEMNSVTDNPLVYSKEDGFDQDKLISAGNFHGQYVAKAADFISMSLLTLGKFSQARIQRYVNQRTSNLPGFLTKNGGLNSGYMILQYTSAALLSQSKVLAKPASADSISTSASQEDHVSMGGYAARKSRQILENISYIIGIQFMCALQSISLIGKKPSQRLQKIFNEARKYITYSEQDTYYGPQIEIAKQLVEKGLNVFV